MSYAPQPEPTVHEFTTNQRLYEAQMWIDQQLNRREFSADVAPHVTVSLVRSAVTGLWSATMYGWPAFEVHTEDVPGQDGAPMIYAGEPVDPLMLGGDTELWTAGDPSSARPVADLGDIVSARAVVPGPQDRVLNNQVMAPGGVPVPPEAMGSFFVPGPFDSAVQAAIDAEQDNARAAVLAPTRLDLKRAAGAFAPPAVGPSVYEDRRPLDLDLDTEEPKPRKESRRARKARERSEQAEAVRAADSVAGNRVLAQESFTVPASGHRPDAAGVAPVEYPVCTSTIEDQVTGDRFTCKRKHAPGTLAPVHQDAPGRSWGARDPRIVHN
jgi:hypothetical protein